jgi:hypothetical protein
MMVREVSEMRNDNCNILKVLDYCTRLLTLSDKGDMERTDDGCGVLYGVVRDAAYKMKTMAERERDAHIKRGAWDSQDQPEEAGQPADGRTQ